MAPVPGSIDRYEIKARIGHGGMGSLYLARDTNPNTDRLVVVKLLRASLDSEDLRRRFAREAQALAGLSHPNIVTIYDSGQFHGSPFIVMEYLRGETLMESIRRRAPMPLGQKLKLLSELCSGLAHAHEAGVVHRDVKPANLMVDVHGRLKILDFGIARILDAGSTDLTRGNVQIGTPGYMSPEQIEGREIDGRSDLFAVGAVAYELIAYREAFSGSTMEIVHKVLHEQPVPLTSLISGLNPVVSATVASALDKDVQRRCQHALMLAHAFDRVRASLGEEPPAPRMRPTPVPGAERKSRRERAADQAYQRAMIAHSEGADGFACRSAMEALAEDPQQADAYRLLSELGRLADVDPWLPGAAAAAPAAFAPADDARTVAVQAVVPPPMPGRPAATQPPAPAPPVYRPVAPQPTAPPQPASIRSYPEPAVAPQPVPQRTVPQHPVAPPPASATRAAEPPPYVPPAPSPQPPPAGSDRTVLWQPAVAAPSSAPPAPEPPAPAADERTVLWQGAMPAAAGSATAPPSSMPAVPEAAPAPAMAAPAPPPAAAKTLPKTAAAKPAQAKPVAKGKPGSQPISSTVIVVAAVVVVLLVGGAVATRFLWAPASGNLLTIGRPSGGTILSDDGLQCGTQGTNCSITRPKGATVQLHAVPDAGFVFSGFTGDCATSGATVVMAAPHACGAKFSPATEAIAGAAPAGPAEYEFVVDMPAGGTVRGGGIQCGTFGTDCSVKQPAGAQVTLAAEADSGFTFTGFSGDCSPGGVTTVSGPIHCVAMFAPVAPAGAVITTPPAGGVPAGTAAPADYVLNITKPVGGTIVGPGIRCGAGGSQCTSRQARGLTVTLTHEAERGYRFVAFTGDCRPAGRTRMIAARRCGATFAKETAAPAATMVVLTILRPTGGTIVGAGVNCGTGGTQCSSEHAPGSSVALKAQPDPGFRFVAFTGDCDASGVVAMSSPRSCGATFAASASAAEPAVGRPWSTNLPNTSVTVTRTDANNVTVVFGGASDFAGYTAVLKGNGRTYAGDATRPGCASPSHVTVNSSSPTVMVGQFELRSCSGRTISKTGMVLTEKR